MVLVVVFGVLVAILGYFFTRVRWHNQALTYLNDGQIDDAIRIFSRVIKYYPQDAIALYHRASAYKRKGDYTAALADYDQAVARGGRMSGVLYGARAYFLMYLGRYDDALADYELALKADPRQPQTQLGIAYAYIFKKDYEKALEKAQIAIDELEKQLATNAKYGAYLLEATPERNIELENVVISVNAAKALALIHLGRGDEARGIYATLAEKYPESMILYVDRAELNFLLNDYDSARADYEKALVLAGDTEFTPTTSGYDFSLVAQAGYAVTLFACGEIEQAQAQWHTLQTNAPLLVDAKRIGKEFFWSDAMTEQAEKMMASLNA
jgi:tetratricopeptide (TPR) repeat protein